MKKISILCEECLYESKISDSFNKNIHRFYCEKCIKKINIISKSRAQKIFVLDDTDLQNLKCIYSKGNNNFKYYIVTDIEKTVINKYGSIENLKKEIIKRKNNYDIKKKTLEQNKQNREKQIKEIFKLNKLEFKNHGDCYSYINYGKPDINLIIENELSKLSLKNKLRLQLSQELDKLNIPFDENIGVCYNYINSIGTKSLHDVVRATEIEYFLNTQTKYNELCKIYDSNTAKEMAMRNYSETNLIPETIEEYSKIKVCFD